MELTDKQKAVVEILVRAERRSEESPTYRELAQLLKCDVRAAYQHIEALEKKGVVERAGGQRGLRLTTDFMPPRGLPVIGRVAAGLPLLAEQNIDDYVDVRHVLVDDDAFLLKVRGDSMVDKHIYDGDFVLVRPRHRLDKGEIGVVSVGSEATVKEVHTFPDRVVLVSHNQTRHYPDQIYTRVNDVRIVGKVVMALRFL